MQRNDKFMTVVAKALLYVYIGINLLMLVLLHL